MTEPTQRQLSVLIAWIEEGGTREAAARLGCSPNTARNHLMALRAALHVHTTAQAAFVAVQRGLIDADTLDVDKAA
jgi:DNA-binding CsgD family transcriptional regulator